MVSSKKFNSSSLKDNGAIIQVWLKSTHKNANIDYYSNINEKTIVVNAIIDTGATHSLIDLTVLNEDIEIEKTQFTEMHLFIHGSNENLPVYKLGFDLLKNGECIDIYAAVMDLSIFKIPELSIKMVIGRDILNQCIFTYNGLDNSFTLDYKTKI